MISPSGQVEKDLPAPSAVPPPPSPALLSSFVTSRRPVYIPAPGIAVPVLRQVPGGAGYLVVPPELYRFRRSPEAVLRSRVATCLSQPEARGARKHELDRNDIAQLRALTAAALHDIAGLSQAQVMEWIGSPTITDERLRELMRGGEPVNGDTRVTRNRVARGRELWFKLAAWPWWAIGLGELTGPLPGRWWELSRVVMSYQAWTSQP